MQRKVLCSHYITITIPDLCAVFYWNWILMFEKRLKTQQMCHTHDLVSQLLYDEKNKTNSSIQKDRSVFYYIVYKCIQKRILQVRIFRNKNTVSWRGAQAVGLKDSPREGGGLEENHRSMQNGKTSSAAGAADDNTATAAGPGRRQTEGSRGSGAGCCRRRKVVFKAAAGVVAEADDDAWSLCGLWRWLGKSSRQRGVACTQ